MQTTMQPPARFAPANSNTLGSFHTIPSQARVPNRAGKIVGGLIGALMLGAGGLYLYSISSSAPPPRVTAAQLPYTPPPSAQ